jgi:hypothetical protein
MKLQIFRFLIGTCIGSVLAVGYVHYSELQTGRSRMLIRMLATSVISPLVRLIDN